MKMTFLEYVKNLYEFIYDRQIYLIERYNIDENTPPEIIEFKGGIGIRSSEIIQYMQHSYRINKGEKK